MKYIISPTPGGGSPAFPPAGGVNAMAYCHGDGVTDDRAHILAAIAAAGSNPVYFLAGEYLLSSTLVVPAGTDLVGPPVSALAYPTCGCETPTAWLKGRMDFGSNCTFSDLRIGPSAAGVAGCNNVAFATNTSFTRCAFRGGGGTPGWKDSGVLALGMFQSPDHITFTDCNMERNLGTENSANSNGYNQVHVYGDYFSGTSSYGAASYITFDGCHIGSSNGVASGSPRMGIECFLASGSEVPYHHIDILGCNVEVCGTHNLDFSDTENYPGHDILIDGCLLQGGGSHPGDSGWGYSINIEFADTVTVTNNTIYRSWERALKFYERTWGIANRPNTHIHNNVFDLDHDNGITPAYQQIQLIGSNIEFTGNTVHYHGARSPVIALAAATADCTVTGNTINKAAGTTAITDAGSGNTITPNTVVDG